MNSNLEKKQDLKKDLNNGVEIDNILKNNKTLKGVDSEKTIFGTSEDDILDGSIGNVKLIGYGGNDTYVFGKGYGTNIIDNWGSANTDFDVLILKDIIFDEVKLSAVDEDLIIKVNGTSDKVIIRRYFKGGEFRIDEVRFADDKIMKSEDILYYLNNVGTEIIGTTGDDIIDSNNIKHGKAIYDGLGGNDKLIGSVGDDTYLFAKGYGINEIYNDKRDSSDIDILLFKDINFDEVNIEEDNFDLVIKVKGTKDKVIVKKYFQNKGYSLEKIIFADGKVMKCKDLVEYLD